MCVDAGEHRTLDTVQGTSHTHWIHRSHCTLYAVHHTHGALYTVPHTVHCTLNISHPVHRTHRRALYTLHHRTLYTLQHCTLYIVHHRTLHAVNPSNVVRRHCTGTMYCTGTTYPGSESVLESTRVCTRVHPSRPYSGSESVFESAEPPLPAAPGHGVAASRVRFLPASATPFGYETSWAAPFG